MIRSSCTGSKQFSCPNYPPLGCPKDLDIELNPELLLDPPFLGNPPPALEYCGEYSRQVAVLHIAPELHESWYEIVYGTNSKFDAVILDAYGLGNLPSNTKITELIAQRSATGLLTFVTTQCHNGNVSADYASSAERLGGILCADMTLPAIYCKVSIMIKKAEKCTSEARRLLGLSLHGDISPPDQGRLKPPGWIYRYFEGLLEPYLADRTSEVCRAVLHSVMMSGGADGMLPIVQDIVGHDKLLLNIDTLDKSNLAHTLAFQSSNKLLDFLKEHNEESVLRTMLQSQDAFGISPVGYCLRTKKHSKIERITAITEGGYVADESVKAHLLAAAASPDTSLLERFLLAKPADLEKINDLENRNLLHIACFQGCTDTVAMLLSEKHNKTQTIRYLLTAKDMDGCLPEDLAALNKHTQVLKVITEAKRELGMSLSN